MKLTDVDKLTSGNPTGWIYFLYRGGVCVYVGKTLSSIEDRIKEHTETKTFDSFSFLQCFTDLDDAEVLQIILNNPEYNLIMPFKSKKYISSREVNRAIWKSVPYDQMRSTKRLFYINNDPIGYFNGIAYFNVDQINDFLNNNPFDKP